jgi:hypothetical protein
VQIDGRKGGKKERRMEERGQGHKGRRVSTTRKALKQRADSNLGGGGQEGETRREEERKKAGKTGEENRKE